MREENTQLYTAVTAAVLDVGRFIALPAKRAACRPEGPTREVGWPLTLCIQGFFQGDEQLSDVITCVRYYFRAEKPLHPRSYANNRNLFPR
ncbi:hypothetical protein GDO78_021649 [Eleutherodactylus coqui]|uniref:Uncharacterized protein n=1 Tax=Eleutherodactylus coqui TaxID=57060 RepID=A0A8J6BH44_ELECQ|nr:hypothetical protein GDO78_021649 [Eleutherodactylus coqui]